MDIKYQITVQNKQEKYYLWLQQNYRLLLKNRGDNGEKNNQVT